MKVRGALWTLIGASDRAFKFYFVLAVMADHSRRGLSEIGREYSTGLSAVTRVSTVTSHKDAELRRFRRDNIQITLLLHTSLDFLNLSTDNARAFGDRSVKGSRASRDVW